MKCPKCGVENPVGDFCGSCGHKLTVPIQTTPEMMNKQKGESRIRKMKIIAIVAATAFALIIILSLAPILSEKVVVTVYSNQTDKDVHYHLYIDGIKKAEGDLAPGGSEIISIILNYGIINEGKSAWVSAIATDGALGDMAFITLQDGSTQSVLFRI